MTEQTQLTPEQVAEVVSTLTIDDLQMEIQKRLDITDEARAAYEQAKEDGYEPVYIRIAAIEFVYRALGRKEWRTLVRAQNERAMAADQDMILLAEAKQDGVEEIAKAGLIWSSKPLDDKVPGGCTEVLSDVILVESGFTGADTDPIKLQ